MRVKRLLEKMSISENSGVCVALFFTSDKQGNNSSSLSKEIQSELSKLGFKFKNEVKTKSFLELHFQGSASRSILSDIAFSITYKFSSKATNFDVYAVL